MLKSAVLFVCCFLVEGLLPAADDISQQLLGIRELVQARKYPEAITVYEKLLQQAPKSLQGSVQFEIAVLHAALGDTDRSLGIMEQAVLSGFDDCPAIEQYEELNKIRSDPRFGKLYSRVRVSEADRKELYWLKAEIQNVSHETKMIITANVNRQDPGITAFTQSAIPARETLSPGILFNRELLRMMHRVQRYYALESDKARMRHLTNMRIISGGASYDQVARSYRVAQLAAEEQKRAVEARKFMPLPGLGTMPRSCSEYRPQ